MEVREQIGLSTQEALSRLHQDIEMAVDEYEASKRERRYELWLKDALHHWSQYTTLCWSSALVIICIGIALICCYIVDSQPRHGNLLFQGLLILTLVGINVYLVVRDNRLRHSEIPRRVRRLLVKLKAASTSCHWVAENYPHLCSPLSPCITLQWALRDGKLVNLPWALLVAGDVIEMRPGQAAPGNCVPLEPGASLTAGQTWSPAPREPCSAPAARSPLPSARFRLQVTPYLGNLRLALSQALDRPVTCFNRQRHLLAIACVEHLLLPIVMVCAIAAGWLRLKYLASWAGTESWTETLVLRPAAAALPLLPVVFPAAWLVLDSLGLARIQARLFISTHLQPTMDPFDEPTAGGVTARVSWRQLAANFRDVWTGEGDIPSRSANLLHVLGSVTALCCVDKKGILSWPNPTAEKVFFLRTSDHSPNNSSMGSLDRVDMGESNQAAPLEEDNDQDELLSNYNLSNADSNCKTVAEVLDLTHDRTSSFRLQFDDHAWRAHAASLKPLGLAILLNTCNMRTQEHYTRFCAHVTCQAMHNEDLVPVINRRCLCELARQIGFVDSAKDIFKLEEQLSTFRHVQPEMVRRDIKFARSLSMSARVKFPFPHMVAVVVRDNACGGLQLLSQGTADMVLDSCVEFWDGTRLAPFSPADRKKVADFYQRTSLTAYCSAFAYRPLTGEISSQMSDVYLELPADAGHLYVPHRSPTPLLWDCRPGLDSRARGMQFHSTDSLLCGDLKDEVVSDAQGCFEVQCNQVFIGMVTMQYQAQTDMVQLIDQLERACIRFVHFSKENELRSRVFSEKMGLESGWNCHISLLSEKSERNRSDAELTSTPAAVTKQGRHLSSPSTSLPKCPASHKAVPADGDEEETAQLIQRTAGAMSRSRALSLSAPSAINMEYSQVKFDEECEDQHSVHSPNEEMEGWRSMSCLTDSTEQSVPVNFDMSNRAKLPRGIDKIRPHLEQIDNVPLLVSLFTDCNPGVTREMLHIMQEYGEVVCVMGSSANADNMPVLLQADASCAVEPLYPQVCQSVPAFVPPPRGPSPVDLSRALNSVACSLSFRREEPVSLYRLVAESRHFMQGLWNCVQFWTCCCISLSLMQLLALLLMLPPLLTTGQVLWLVCAIIPALSLSLAALPTDFQVMERATGKNQCAVTKQMAIFVFWCYGCKFLAPLLTQLLFFALTLNAACADLANRTNGTCTVVYPRLTAPGGGWAERHESLQLVQHLVMLSIIVQFVTISVSFVQRKYGLLKRSPFNNQVWMCIVGIILSVQAGYSWVYLGTAPTDSIDVGISDVPLAFLIGHLALSPLVVFALVEIIKREEVKTDIRFQKRERLDFDTKLGMNSPF